MDPRHPVVPTKSEKKSRRPEGWPYRPHSPPKAAEKGKAAGLTMPPQVISFPKETKALLYRQYRNHAYHKDRLKFWKGSYPEYPQSRPAIAASKIQSGMRDYNLQRASKYGNVCHDCAAVLELAPGLLVRNYRKSAFKKGDFLPKLKVGDETTSNYLEGMQTRSGHSFFKNTPMRREAISLQIILQR